MKKSVRGIFRPKPDQKDRSPESSEQQQQQRSRPPPVAFPAVDNDWNVGSAAALRQSSSGDRDTNNNNDNQDVFDQQQPSFAGSSPARSSERRSHHARSSEGRSQHTRSSDISVDSSRMERPSYRVYEKSSSPAIGEFREEDEEEEDDDALMELRRPKSPQRGANRPTLSQSVVKAKNIEESAGTHRLNRILSKNAAADEDRIMSYGGALSVASSQQSSQMLKIEKRIHNPKNLQEVANFSARVVIPPLSVDPSSIGGSMLDSYPANMQQETLVCFQCQSFEATGNETVAMTALQYPNDYAKHKRSLGLFQSMGTKGRNKIRYVLLARSTNRPLLKAALAADQDGQLDNNKAVEDESERDDYDTMFAPQDDDSMSNNSMSVDDASESGGSTTDLPPNVAATTTTAPYAPSPKAIDTDELDEISSFPVLVCMTLHSDGSAPDIRKLIPLDQLTTVQDLHTTVLQLAFSNGDTVRIDFGGGQLDESKAVEGSMDKERFIWSLLQVHAMLCIAVVERNSMEVVGGRGERKFLPPLNVRNLDRAELQYMATVNGFLRDSKTLCALLDRQRDLLEDGAARGEEGKVDLEDMDGMAYDLMMGNFATRVSLFHSEEERKDSEEILNSTEWTNSLNKEETAAVSVAERLGLMLQWRMRDLEAETCRRLIAWEDEKHSSVAEKAQSIFTSTDERDTVDALALASLFKTLESLDTELSSMEEWLIDRAAAIKPLTDDCADIEEENRQLEQQWKSYEMLGSEMRRLLQGLEITEAMEKVLQNPASALVYDEDGLVDVDASEQGVEQIYQAGKSLQEAMDYPKRSGGMHLEAVSERAEGLTAIATNFCTALAQIIVTVMEQFKTEVVAGSDYGKVSKSDTHTMIAKKIRDTQRKFQSALLGYIKLIEILSALSPEMLPALRDAYSEMVAEGILMKKRMKGYFQALPGKNAAYMNKAGKDLKDYVPFDDAAQDEMVGAPDIRAALSELLPVIAREAYFTSALFGAQNKDKDGREKKRNFENVRKAVDNGSQHFRYYINRTCGILPGSDISGKATADMTVKGDPLLCLVASICLNEAIDNYVDREKKGGDHSLSLAYVRATILELRKRADKQWVIWVEKQIAWIRSKDGVPLTGKRAGIFPSFGRFPCYLDHVLACCREGRDPNYTPDINHIKVISYYMQKLALSLLESLKECAARETTDQQYAANVMKMENTYYFTHAIKHRGPVFAKLFAKQVAKANALCKESTDSYLGWMIKREFAPLHELFSRISKTRKEFGEREVIKQVPKNQFVRTLSKEASRDALKEKIGIMYGRMEKHLSEEGGLLPIVWKALVKVLYEWFGRWEKLSGSIYRQKLDPTPVDVVRIAKAAGGDARVKSSQAQGEFGFKSILALGASKTSGGER